jgi:hypothetical protein
MRSGTWRVSQCLRQLSSQPNSRVKAQWKCHYLSSLEISLSRTPRSCSSELVPSRREDLNVRHIQQLANRVGLERLNRRQLRDLWVVQELVRQQQLMHRERTHAVAGRIVSLSQPHVRPIVRGKLAEPVEFGAKLSVSVVDGYCHLDRLSWDNYNEIGTGITRLRCMRTRRTAAGRTCGTARSEGYACVGPRWVVPVRIECVPDLYADNNAWMNGYGWRLRASSG